MKTLSFFLALSLTFPVLIQASDQAPNDFCKEPNLAIARLNKHDLESDCLYYFSHISVFQKTADGYLLEVSAPYSRSDYDTPPPMFLYWFPEFQFNSPNYNLGNFTGYYVGDYSYQTITGFDRTIPAFKIGPIPERLKPENREFVTNDSEPNFISKNGRVIPNPNKMRS